MSIRRILETLANRTAAERYEMWKKARAARTADGAELAKAIEDSGLAYTDDACLKSTDPVTLKMGEIIYSTVGKAACLQATANGLPAIAGVDAMLSEALGIEYRGGSSMATQTAGGIVGALMTTLGYKNAAQRPMPPGSVAKTGAYWVPARALPKKRAT